MGCVELPRSLQHTDSTAETLNKYEYSVLFLHLHDAIKEGR